MKLSASCHCGSVLIEVDEKPLSVTRCNCSICHRYGANWAYYTRRSARVSCAPDATSAYLWNDREIEFHHCRNCGCLTHYESIEKGPDSRVAINTRMMSPADISDVPIRFFDGADTWKYLD